jgi:PAS domain-containing protein
MDERRREHRSRTLRSGKIVFNGKRSVIDCVVRNLSDTGACLQVSNPTSVPPGFELVIDGDGASGCHVVWRSDTRVGIAFDAADAGRPGDTAGADASPHADTPAGTELLMLRAALDEVPVGIVLLDADMRARFINRAFRRMWRLPDAKADGRPPFVALMYHGRDTNAYAIPPEELDDYVADRVALIEAGSSEPRDLRLTNGEVLRLNCTVLPSGGRMLCYTYVTDIARQSGESDTPHGRTHPGAAA